MEIKIKGYTTKKGIVVKGFTKQLNTDNTYIGKDTQKYKSVRRLKKRMDFPHCWGNYKHSCAKGCKSSVSCFMLAEQQKKGDV